MVKKHRQICFFSSVLFQSDFWTLLFYTQREKFGNPWESTRDIYQHTPPIYGLCNGFL